MIKYISWDLQGTISAADFSDNFWLELLPKVYAEKQGCDLATAKDQLWKQFKAMGKYDIRYYDDAYWAEQLGFGTIDVLCQGGVTPRLDAEIMEYIANLSIPSIILSTTTTVFIDYELGDKKSLFLRAYSCVDDFRTGGKTPEIFRAIANQLNVLPDEILHIGDNQEMDITNAEQAGVRTLYYDNDASKLIATVQRLLEESEN